MSSENIWDKTQVALNRLGWEIDWNFGEPYYMGFPVISRDSSVRGGVSIGEHPRGAIYVPKDSKLLEDLANEVIEHSKRDGRVDKSLILKNTYNIVRKVFTDVDMKKVEAIYNYYNVSNDGIVSLDTFLESGVGVCIHQALTAAAVLEILKEKGVIKGHPNVNRNKGYANGELYGHAWVRYTNSAGEIFIIDTALGYLGKLEDSKNWEWNYHMPNE